MILRRRRRIEEEEEEIFIITIIMIIITTLGWWYIEEKIVNTHQNCKCRLYVDQNEPILYISECSTYEVQD